MQNLGEYVPLPEHIVERRRRIVVGEADLTTECAEKVEQDSGANRVASADEIKALKAATIQAKDGYVTRPNRGAAGVSVWVPRGWRCEQSQPSWSTSLLQFSPVLSSNDVNAQRKPKAKATAASGSALTISTEAASDPVACLRLTIRDLHSEVGEQTATEYCSDLVSNIYRDQTRFITNKYKVAGPKIVLDQQLGQKNDSADYDTATTTTDDDDFNAYQKAMAKLGGATSSSSAGVANSKHGKSAAVPALGGFTNILSYQTETVINRSAGQPKRVSVCSTSVVAVKGRFLYSFELQSSPANHAVVDLSSSSALASHGEGSSGKNSGIAEHASASWAQCFFQMAQVMHFNNDPRGNIEATQTQDNNLKVQRSIRSVVRLEEGPYCKTQLTTVAASPAPFAEISTIPLWTPSLAEASDTASSNTEVSSTLPLLKFDTNSEEFPARIEVFAIRSAVPKDEQSLPAIHKVATTSLIAALGLSRSYSSAAITISCPSSNGYDANVTIVPCALPPQAQTMSSPLSARRVAIRFLPFAGPATSVVSVVAVEVPLRRNHLKTPAGDLASCVSSFKGVHGVPAEDSNGFFDQLSELLQPPKVISLSRRFYHPAMGYSILVGDGCQCLATTLQPSEVTIAIRPTVAYLSANCIRSPFDTIVPATVEEDEGLLTIAATYEPQISSQSEDTIAMTGAREILGATDMDTMLLRSLQSIAAEISDVAVDVDSIIVSDYLSMVGAQRRGTLVAGHDSDEGRQHGKFVPSSSGAILSALPSTKTPSTFQEPLTLREWPALQAHLRSVQDPSNGVFVTVESVYEVSTNRGVVIKVVSPNFSLFRRHRALIVDGLLSSFEFIK